MIECYAKSKNTHKIEQLCKREEDQAEERNRAKTSDKEVKTSMDQSGRGLPFPALGTSGRYSGRVGVDGNGFVIGGSGETVRPQFRLSSVLDSLLSAGYKGALSSGLSMG